MVMAIKSCPNPGHRGRRGMIGGSLPRAEPATLPITLPTFSARQTRTTTPPPLKTVHFRQPLRALLEGIETVGSCNPEVVDYVARSLTVFPTWATGGIKHVILRGEQGPRRGDGYRRAGNWYKETRTITIDFCARALDQFFIVELADTLAHEIGHSVYDRWEQQALGEAVRVRQEGHGDWMEMISQAGAEPAFGLKREFMAEASKQGYQSLVNWTNWQRAWADGQDGVTPYSVRMDSTWETAAEMTTFWFLHKRPMEPKFTGRLAVEWLGERRQAAGLKAAFCDQMELFAASASAVKQLFHIYPKLSQDELGINASGKSYPAPHEGNPGHHGGSRPRITGPSDIAQRQAILTPAGERRIRAQGRVWQRDSVEHAALFDADGNVIVQTQGGQRAVDIPGAWQEDKRAAVFMHTHPTDADVWEAQNAATDVLSAPDIYAISQVIAPEVWLVTPWRTIRVQKPSQGWPQSFVKDMNAVYVALEGRPRERMPKAALTLDGINSRVRQFMFSHGAFDQLVQKYGGSMWVEYHTEFLYPRRGRSEREPSRVGMSPKAPRFPAQPIHREIENPNARWPRRADSQQHLFPLSAVKSYPNLPGAPHRGRLGQRGGSLPRARDVASSGEHAGLELFTEAERARLTQQYRTNKAMEQAIEAAGLKSYGGDYPTLFDETACRVVAETVSMMPKDWPAETTLEVYDLAFYDLERATKFGSSGLWHPAGDAYGPWAKVGVAPQDSPARIAWAVAHELGHSYDMREYGHTSRVLNSPAWLKVLGGWQPRDMPIVEELADKSLNCRENGLWRTVRGAKNYVVPKANVLTNYSLAHPGEAFAEAVACYVVAPQALKTWQGGKLYAKLRAEVFHGQEYPGMIDYVLQVVDVKGEATGAKSLAGRSQDAPADGVVDVGGTTETLAEFLARYDVAQVAGGSKSYFNPGHRGRPGRVGGSLPRAITVPGPASGRIRVRKPAGVRKLEDAVAGANARGRIRFGTLGPNVNPAIVTAAADAIYALPEWASWGVRSVQLRGAAGPEFEAGGKVYERGGDWSAWSAEIGLDDCDIRLDSAAIKAKIAHEAGHAFFNKWEDLATAELMVIFREHYDWIANAAHVIDGQAIGYTWLSEAGLKGIAGRTDVPFLRALATWRTAWAAGEDGVTPYSANWAKSGVDCETAAEMCKLYFKPAFGGGLSGEAALRGMSQSWRAPHLAEALLAAVDAMQAEIARFKAGQKHYGPGPHPGTGTPQSSHGGGGNVAPYDPVWVYSDGTEKFQLLAHEAVNQIPVELRTLVAQVDVMAEEQSEVRMGGLLAGHWDQDNETIELYDIPGARSLEKVKDFAFHEVGHAAYDHFLYLAKADADAGKLAERLQASWLEGGYAVTPYAWAWAEKAMAYREDAPDYPVLRDAAEGEAFAEVCSAYLRLGRKAAHAWLLKQRHKESSPLAARTPYASRRTYAEAAMDALDLVRRGLRSGLRSAAKSYPAPHAGRRDKVGGSSPRATLWRQPKLALRYPQTAAQERERQAELERRLEQDAAARAVTPASTSALEPSLRQHLRYFTDRSGSFGWRGEDGRYAVGSFNPEHGYVSISQIHANLGRLDERSLRQGRGTRMFAEILGEAQRRGIAELHLIGVGPQGKRLVARFERWGIIVPLRTWKEVGGISDDTAEWQIAVADPVAAAAKRLAEIESVGKSAKSYSNPGHRGRPGQVGGSLPREQGQSAYGSGGYGMQAEMAAWLRAERKKFYAQPPTLLDVSLPNGGTLGSVGMVDPAWQTAVPRWLADVPPWAADLIQTVTLYGGAAPEADTMASMDRINGRMAFMMCIQAPGVAWGGKDGYAENLLRHELSHAVVQEWFNRAYREQQRAGREHPEWFASSYWPDDDLVSLKDIDYDSKVLQAAPELPAQYPYLYQAIQAGHAFFELREDGVNAYSRSWSDEPTEIMAEFGKHYFRRKGRVDEAAVRKLCASKTPQRNSWGYVDHTRAGAPIAAEAYLAAMRLLAVDYEKAHAAKSYPGPNHRGRPGKIGGSLPRVAGRPVAKSGLNPAAGGYQTLPYASAGKPKFQTSITDAPGYDHRVFLAIADTGNAEDMARHQAFYTDTLNMLGKEYPGLFQNVASVEVYATEETFWTDGAEWTQEGEWKSDEKRVRLFLYGTRPAAETLRHEAAHSLEDLWLKRHNADMSRQWNDENLGNVEGATYPWLDAWDKFSDGLRAGEDGVSEYTRAAFGDGFDVGRSELFAWAFESIAPADFTPDGMRAHMQKYGLQQTADGMADFMRLLQAEAAGQKHYGPGSHPGTGTSQEVHAGMRFGTITYLRGVSVESRARFEQVFATFPSWMPNLMDGIRVRSGKSPDEGVMATWKATRPVRGQGAWTTSIDFYEANNPDASAVLRENMAHEYGHAIDWEMSDVPASQPELKAAVEAWHAAWRAGERSGSAYAGSTGKKTEHFAVLVAAHLLAANDAEFMAQYPKCPRMAQAVSDILRYFPQWLDTRVYQKSYPNPGHRGRPGQVGGSLPRATGGTPDSDAAPAWAMQPGPKPHDIGASTLGVSLPGMAEVAQFNADGLAIAEPILTARFGPHWLRGSDPLLIGAWIDPSPPGLPLSEWSVGTLNVVADTIQRYIKDTQKEPFLVNGQKINAYVLAQAAANGNLIASKITRMPSTLKGADAKAVLAEAKRIRDAFIVDYPAEYAKLSGPRPSAPEQGGNISYADDAMALMHAVVSDLARDAKLPYDDAHEMIHQWAQTSNKSFAAYSLQREAARMFAGRVDDWQARIGDSPTNQALAIATVLRARSGKESSEGYAADLLETKATKLWQEEDRLKTARAYLKLQTEADYASLQRARDDVYDLTSRVKSAKSEVANTLSGLGLTPGKQENMYSDAQADHGAKARASLGAIYRKTQDYLAQRFPDGYVTLYRGMKTTRAPDVTYSQQGGWAKYQITGTRQLVQRNAMESWSLDSRVATRFGNVIVAARVPISRIVSTAVTGWGAFNEAEFIVVGDSTRDEMWVWRYRK